MIRNVRYFEKLCRDVGIGESGKMPYVNLAELLMNIPFEVVVDEDWNRFEDAKQLRMDILADKCFDGPPSVMELLVSLSEKLFFMSDGLVDDIYNSVGWWFMTLISNLGLAQCTDDAWEKNPGYYRCMVGDAIDVWMYRSYDFNGSSGGLFPLDNPKDDQTKVDLWYQMNAYLKEYLAKQIGENV